MFTNAVYNGYEGVRDHFVRHMGDNEHDLTGRLYLHEMVTPLIEVAGDAQTAKCIDWHHRLRDRPGKEEGNVSLWSFARYRFDFAKEDGAWKIWHQHLYITFLTPLRAAAGTRPLCYPIHEIAAQRGLAKPPAEYVSYFAIDAAGCRSPSPRRTATFTT